IIKSMGLSKNNVHLVPGNHDISRDMTRTLLIDSIMKSPNPSEMLDKLDQKATNILVEGQRKFFDFYEDFMGVKYPEEDL
ncbi:metallophosphoesterase, partial [Staphylococcus aureus]|nr:metallophosphoesterase [Staphylococcus aureus]